MRHKRSQPLGQRNIRADGAELLSGDRRQVHRIGGHATLQVLEHLRDNPYADNFLSFFCRPTNMRSGNDVVELQQRLTCRRRLGLKYVERGSAHMTRHDRLGQGHRVDQFAPRAIDDPHATLHFRERKLIDHALGRRRQSDVQRDVVGTSPECFLADQFDSQVGSREGIDKRIGRDDGHLERAGTLGDLASNRTQAEDAQRLAAQLRADELRHFPLACFGGLAREGNGPRERQH